LTISGTFDIASAQIEDTLLVIIDKTGTRKLRLKDFETSKNAAVNVDGTASTTIAEWLASAGIDFNNFTVSNYSDDKVIGSSSGKDAELLGEINDEDGDGRIAIDPEYKPSPLPESVKVVKEDPIKGSPSKSGNTRGGTVTVDLSTVDAAQTEVTGGTLSNSYPNVTTFTRNGLTIHLLGTSSSTSGRPNDENSRASLITAKTFDELTDDQKTIIAGLFKWWGKECLKLNEDSYDLGFTAPTAMVKDIGLYFFDGDENCNTLATVWNWQRQTADGYAAQLMLNVNMKYYKNLSDTDVDGETAVSGAGFLDRTLAHEFNHAIFAANFSYFNALPKFIKEGVAELTHGIDDERGNVIFHIAYDDAWLAGSLALDNTGTGSQAVGDGYAGGYMFWRYLAKQAAAQTLPAFGSITATVNLGSDGDYYISGDTTTETASTTEGAIKLGTLQNGVYTVADTGVHQVINATSAVKVSGLTVNDTFNGSGGADTIETDEGSDIITGAGNDSINLRGQYATINTGADNDTVSVVDGGHHSIDLGDGNNQINFTPSFNYGNSVTSGAGNNNIAQINGADNVIKTGDGDDTLGTYNNISNENNLFDAGAGADKITVGAGSNNTFLGGAGDDLISFINFSGGDTAITDNYIDAGDGADKVTVYGSNNTIVGGAGDDTLYSNGTGGNIFLYNTPFDKDNISNLKANDILLFAADYNAEVSGDGTTRTLTVTKDSVTVGTITVTTTSGVTFDAAANIRYAPAGQILSNTDADAVTGTNLDDIITNTAANATIDARAGNDTITSTADNASISAGTGNDQITVSGTGNTVAGGAGDDVITNDSGDTANVYTFTEDSFGKDTVRNFKAADKIVFAAGMTYETQAAQDDSGKITIAVTKGGNAVGTITLENVSGTFDAATNITGGSPPVIDVIENAQQVTLTEGADIIYVNAAQVDNFKLSGTFGAGDKIIVYRNDKDIPLSCTPAVDDDGNLILRACVHSKKVV